MALRMRRSLTLGGGVRTGVQGASYTVNPSARRTRAPGVPAAGVTQAPTAQGRRRRTGASAQPPPNWSIPAKPGMLALPHERNFFMGLEELKRGQPELALERFETAARRDTGNRALSDDLLAGLTAIHVGDAARAIPHLEVVVASDAELPDALLEKYAPELAFELSITPEVSALIRAGSMAAALALVECYQEVRRHDEAVGLLQQLIEVEDAPALKLSLCELYAEAADWDEVVELGAGVANEDDLTLQILLYRATALAERGDDQAALAVYQEALDSKNGRMSS
jgi:tetratricopeptide (TPR) repeat protein